jgi:hypothetical protein
MCRRALVLLALSSCSGCEPVLGPEGEIARVLEVRQSGPAFTLDGKTLQLHAAHFDRVLVKPEGEGFTAVTTVDAEGTIDKTQVSYLGLERIPFVRIDGHWQPKEALLPALREVAELLSARRTALGTADAAALGELVSTTRWLDSTVTREVALAQLKDRIGDWAGRYEPTAWIVRVEREGAEVLEEYTLTAPQGTTRRGKIRFQLVREDRLRFGSGPL